MTNEEIIREAAARLGVPLYPEATRPTFDEWYLAKYTHTFEYVYEQPHTPLTTHHRALSRALRDYVSEMVRLP